MMTASVQYLEAAKIEEVAAELRSKGYEVSLHPQGLYEGYDLIATKGDKKLAVEVKANTQLHESAESIKTLHRRAVEQGIDEFRLVVVSPPHEVKVAIEKLEEELFSYITQNLSSLLANTALAAYRHVAVTGVANIDINSINVARDGVRVVGDGAVEIEIGYLETKQGPFWSAGFPPRKFETFRQWETALPFTFDVKLNHELTISEVQKLEIDTSSLDD